MNRKIHPLIIIAVIALCVHVAWPPVNESRLDQLVVGTTTSAEVQRLLGSPSTISKSISGGQHWHYSTPLRLGYLDVYFDPAGRLSSSNYERE